MNIKNGKMKTLISVSGIVLVLSVLIMGFFQIRASVRMGSFTGESMRRTLSLSLYHTIRDLLEGEQQLFSLLHLSRDKNRDNETVMAKEVLDQWYVQEELPAHLDGAYLKLGETEEIFYRYFPGDEEVVLQDELPRGLFSIPFWRPGETVEILLAMDKDLLFGVELPEILTALGDDYSWRIVNSNSETIAGTGFEDIDYPPELKIPLGDKFLFIFNDLRVFQAFTRKDDRDFHDDAGDRPDFPPDMEDREWGYLEVYFSAGPLNRIVSRTVFLNLIAGVTALAMILGGYFLLFRLYRSSEAQREREQEFVSTISHELRTPLAVLSSAGENISRGIVREDRITEYGKMITRESRRLEDMIEGVLFYSGLQRGNGRVVVKEEVLLKNLFAELEERFAMKAREMEILLDFSIPEDFPSVKTGRQALSIILGNLIYNGLIHAYPPGFRINPEDRIVSVSSRISGNDLVILVEDRGCGIPVKERKKIFKAFVRGDKSRRNQIPGSGLGLHIAGRVAGLSGGVLELVYDHDKYLKTGNPGTVFKLTLYDACSADGGLNE